MFAAIRRASSRVSGLGQCPLYPRKRTLVGREHLQQKAAYSMTASARASGGASMSANDSKRTWRVYRHADAGFLFDLNQIQNFRLQLSSMVFCEAGVIGFQVRVFSAVTLA